MDASQAGAYVTALVSFMTALGMFLKLRSDNEKNRAEIAKLLAEASKTHREENFVGISVVRDISEASAVLLVPLKQENKNLWDRVGTLEEKVDHLESQLDVAKRENDVLLRNLHEERDRNNRAQLLFEERQKEIMRQHKREMADMEARLSGGQQA